MFATCDRQFDWVLNPESRQLRPGGYCAGEAQPSATRRILVSEILLGALVLGTNTLTIPLGHTVDAMRFVVGDCAVRC
jgi:hypothetical protein